MTRFLWQLLVNTSSIVCENETQTLIDTSDQSGGGLQFDMPGWSSNRADDHEAQNLHNRKA